MIPLRIKSLTVNLAPTYMDGGLGAVMAQIQEDLDDLRMNFFDDHCHGDERNRNLNHLSLYVNLSAVSAQRPLPKGWILRWVSLICNKWREREEMEARISMAPLRNRCSRDGHGIGSRGLVSGGAIGDGEEVRILNAGNSTRTGTDDGV